MLASVLLRVAGFRQGLNALQVNARWLAKVREAVERLSQLEDKVAKRQAIRDMLEVVRGKKVLDRARRAIEEWHAREVKAKWLDWMKRQMVIGKGMRAVTAIIVKKELNRAF